jgi:hypothetical protein
MRRRHPAQQRVGFQDQVLLLAKNTKIAAVIHSPDPLFADLGDIPFQFRRLQVGSQPRNQSRQPTSVLLIKLAVEHIVLALMPHHRFEAISNTTVVQILQGITDQLECPRIKLLAICWGIGIPVKSDRGPADRRLDDCDRSRSMSPNFPSKRHLRAKRIQWLERHPTLGGFITFAKDIRIKDITLWITCTFETRIIVNSIGMGIRTDHVGLAGEDEDSRHFFGVRNRGYR